MKSPKPRIEKKSPGTALVEKYRPRMNKLSRAERQKLLDRAMQIAYAEVGQRVGDRSLSRTKFGTNEPQGKLARPPRRDNL